MTLADLLHTLTVRHTSGPMTTTNKGTGRIIGFSWIGKALAVAIAVGAGAMEIGAAITDVGFQVTMCGFAVWAVSSAVKYLTGPTVRMFASNIASNIPLEVAA